MSKSKIKDILAWIGGAWVLWQIVNYLNDAGILHLTLPGGH
jgi:hypothetical protein